MKRSVKKRSVVPLGMPSWWDEPAPPAPAVRGEQLEQLVQILERANYSVPTSVTSPRSRRTTASGSGGIFESIGDGCYRTVAKPGAE